MLNFLRKKLKIENDKFHYFKSKIGNTVSNTSPIVMVEKIKENVYL